MNHTSQFNVSNWGRWGSEDERGTLNLLTPQHVLRAASLIKTGKVYSLSMPLEANGPQWPTRHKTWRVTTHGIYPTGRGSADDVVTLHSHSGTHMDALCHIWYDNQLYNGYNAAENVTSQGALRNSIDRVPSIVGRAVLLDIAKWKGVDHLDAGEAISASDLDACAAMQGVTIEAGDILLLRTGWMRVFRSNPSLYNSGEPGIDESTIAWLHRHDVVGVGADNQAIEVLTEIPPARLPVHMAAIRDLGLYLIENLNLDELAADNVQTCLIVIAPLQLTAAIGSPVNPIAIA